jgi:hypothetical protein
MTEDDVSSPAKAGRLERDPIPYRILLRCCKMKFGLRILPSDWLYIRYSVFVKYPSSKVCAGLAGKDP